MLLTPDRRCKHPCNLHHAQQLHKFTTQLCVHAQRCIQGSGDTTCLFCMLGAVQTRNPNR
jgi:hypothetical protein